MYRAAWPQWPKLLPGCLLPLACSHTKPDWATYIFISSFTGRLFGCFLKYLVGFNLVDRVDLLGEVAEKPRFHRLERPWKALGCWFSWETEIKHFCGITNSEELIYCWASRRTILQRTFEQMQGFHMIICGFLNHFPPQFEQKPG